ncbi:hypothetical protein G6F22_019379 [Rhizopus arrhizus]|nr:hypothetical protein G6F22_019379 [Rhizopus arrhizus]
MRQASSPGHAGRARCAGQTRWSRPARCRAPGAAGVSTACLRRNCRSASAAGHWHPAQSARDTARRPGNRSPVDTGGGDRWRYQIRNGARSRTQRRCRTANRQ